jgi:hypothetical protein
MGEEAALAVGELLSSLKMSFFKMKSAAGVCVTGAGREDDGDVADPGMTA